jgi:pimeloyl-ACP methyl ester carboxylesterase
MKFTPINGLKTGYYSAGQGTRDVLFLHGWASSGRMWLRTMWALRHDYRMWAIDLPGFGSSDAPDVDWYSTGRFADHAAAFCQAQAIRPYAVVGHSMGGRVALDLARRCPHLAGRLVAVSPTITGRLGFFLDLLLAGGVGRMMIDASRHVWPLAMAGTMTQYWAPHYLGSEGVRRTTSDLQRASWAALVGSLQAMVEHDYSPHLDAITRPTLLLCGTRDITVPPDDSRLAAERLPNARLVMLDGVHHQLTDEAPAAFLAALRSFLAEEKPFLTRERPPLAEERQPEAIYE